MVNKRDTRVDGWFLMSSPFPTLAIVATYIYFVKSLGPRLMKDRQPFELKKAIIIYNIIQVTWSIYMVYKVMVHGWLYRYSLTCQPVDYSNDPDELVVVNLCWWYYFCKFTEFADTIFFVLRKKFDQITNLHVIHHSIMPATVWWGVRFTPGGHATFFGTLNTFVHIVMYTYYLLAAMGPRYQKYLWWKKHLTTMQMIQFVTVFFHSVQVLFNGCNFPKIIAYAMCFNSLMFLGLFSNFYVQAYIKRRRLPKAVEDKAAEALAAPVNASAKAVPSNGANGDIGAIITNVLSNAASACYIGQTGLYQQSNGKADANGYSNGYQNGYSTTPKKNL